MALSTFTGGVFNSGTISAGSDVAVLIGGSGSDPDSVTISLFSGGIDNAGEIHGRYGIVVGATVFATGRSVAVSTFAGVIRNTGTVSGLVSAIRI